MSSTTMEHHVHECFLNISSGSTMASQVAKWWRILPVKEMQDTGVWSLGREDPLKKEMATRSRILAWRIPWTEEPGGLLFMGSQSRMQLNNGACLQWTDPPPSPHLLQLGCIGVPWLSPVDLYTLTLGGQQVYSLYSGIVALPLICEDASQTLSIPETGDNTEPCM